MRTATRQGAAGRARGLVGAACGAAAVLLAASAAGAATVHGRVVHGGTGRPVPGLEVRVVGMESGKPPVEVVVRTDPQGTFRARLVPERRTYVVQVTYQGVPYTSGPHPASRPSPAKVQVFDATRDPPPLRVARRAVLLEHRAPWFLVREVAVVDNPSPRTYVGSEPGAGTWRLPLLRGAEDVRVVRGLVPGGMDPDGALVDTLPVQPGGRAAVVVYRVRARGPSLLELPTGLPTRSLDVFVAEPLRVRSDVLRVRETRPVEGRAVTWLEAHDLPPRAVVALAVEGVPAPGSAAGWLVAAVLGAGCVLFVAWPWRVRRG